MNGVVDALAVSGRDLYAGGYFGTAGGKVSPYIARANLLTLPTVPTATLVFLQSEYHFEVAGQYHRIHCSVHDESGFTGGLDHEFSRADHR